MSTAGARWVSPGGAPALLAAESLARRGPRWSCCTGAAGSRRRAGGRTASCFWAFPGAPAWQLEQAARRPRRYGGVTGLVGGLSGPPGRTRDDSGDLAGTPVFLAAGDANPQVPWRRVRDSAKVPERLGAPVELRRYPGVGPTITGDQIDFVRGMMGELVAPGAAG